MSKCDIPLQFECQNMILNIKCDNQAKFECGNSIKLFGIRLNVKIGFLMSKVHKPDSNVKKRKPKTEK